MAFKETMSSKLRQTEGANLNLEIGDLAHRLQRESGYTSQQGSLLTASISPHDLLNDLTICGYRRLTGPVCRNDIAYLRLSSLVQATTKLTWVGTKLRLILPIDTEPIGQLGNLLLSMQLPQFIKEAWQCHRMIDHGCGPQPETPYQLGRWLDKIGTMFGIPLICYRLDGNLLFIGGPLPDVERPPLRILLHQGYWFRVERLSER